MQLYGYDATPEMKRDFDAINEHHLRKFGFLPEGRETSLAGTGTAGAPVAARKRGMRVGACPSRFSGWVIDTFRESPAASAGRGFFVG